MARWSRSITGTTSSLHSPFFIPYSSFSILVTDAFHTRRAARTFRTLLPAETIIIISAPPDPRYNPARWWRTEDGLASVFTELIKLMFYWTKYGIRPF